jgi:hypothetical protein
MVGHRGWLLLHKSRRGADEEMKAAVPVAARLHLKEGPRLNYSLAAKGEDREYVLLSFGKTTRAGARRPRS